MGSTQQAARAQLGVDIVRRLGRRQSTATVLLNQAVADRVGLGPTDHKCLDLLLDRGAMTSSRLAAISGLTSGAIAGVVARLESAGFVHRVPDPQDRRKQILSAVPDRVEEIGEFFAAFHTDVTELLDGFDDRQLDAIATFLERTAHLALRHAALLRQWPAVPGESDRGSGSRAGSEVFAP